MERSCPLACRRKISFSLLCFVLLVVLVLCLPLAAAAGSQNTITYDAIQVIRTVPEKTVIGDKTMISLEFVNTGTGKKTVELKELLSPGADFDQASVVRTVITHKG